MVVKKGLTEVIQKVWNEVKIPEEWRTSIIVPLYKRGDPNVIPNYRGISLLCTAYKIYTEIIRRRLVEEVEEKKALPESQMGFRKGRSTLDNIYILNHIVQREKMKMKEEKKVYALFIDLKAAFDNVDRGKLWRILEEKQISGYLIEKMKNIYARTEAAVRVKNGLTRSFKITKGVRQGCVLSPILFNLYIADLDKYLAKRNIGGIRVGNERIWSLAYADDIVLLAKNKTALQDMMDTLKKFLKDRKLELCIEKTKLIIFNSKGKNKWERVKWRNKEIETVTKFKYLGFTFNRKCDYTDHIRDICRKGRIAANRVWGLGERICKNDFCRRWMLFKYLVMSVMAYGVEIWGWEEKKDLKKVMLDYIRWIYKIDFCTPRYVITRELCIDKLKIGWGIRALNYEDRIKNAELSCITKKCWLEKGNGMVKELYSREKEKFCNRNGWSVSVVEEKGNNVEARNDVIIRRERDIQRQWEESRLRKAKYNTRYYKLGKDGVKPWYLQRRNLDDTSKGDIVRALLKLRCGNLSGT